MGRAMRAFKKPSAERRIELATWGLLAVWVGVMLIVDERHGVANTGAGAILLASALLQRAMGFEAGLFLWALGIYFFVTGVGRLADADMIDLPVLAVALIVAGLFLLIRAVSGRWPPGGLPGRGTRERTPLD